MADRMFSIRVDTLDLLAGVAVLAALILASISFGRSLEIEDLKADIRKAEATFILKSDTSNAYDNLVARACSEAGVQVPTKEDFNYARQRSD